MFKNYKMFKSYNISKFTSLFGNNLTANKFFFTKTTKIVKSSDSIVPTIQINPDNFTKPAKIVKSSNSIQPTIKIHHPKNPQESQPPINPNNVPKSTTVNDDPLYEHYNTRYTNKDHHPKIKNQIPAAPNQNTSKFFEAMSDIYKYGIVLQEFPKVILIGMQSGGKSSVCEALSGNGKGILPKFMGMATMKPTNITTIRSDHPLYKVGDKEFRTEEAAKSEIERANQNTHINEINIVVHEQDISNSKFVDLPGLFHTDKTNPELPKKISAITKKYLQDPNNIIAIVHSGGTDIATNKALSYVEKADMLQNSIGIITKTDLTDNSSTQMIIDLLNNKNYKLGYGYCAVVLRGKDEIEKGMTVGEKIVSEKKFFDVHSSLKPSGVPELRKMISNIQFDKIKNKIPQILTEIDKQIDSLNNSNTFLDNLVNDPNKQLAIKLRVLIEKLIGSSPERAEFEKNLSDEFKTKINEYMRTTFVCNDRYSAVFSVKNINQDLKYFGEANHINPSTYKEDNFKILFDYGQVSPIIVDDQTIKKSYDNEIGLATVLPFFDIFVNDPLGKKRNNWNRNLRKYFSGLLENNKIQDIVYEITERNILKYINDDFEGSNDLTTQFAEYLVKEIGQEVYESKIKFSITAMINTEKRPNLSVFEISRQLVQLYEPHFDFYSGIFSYHYKCSRKIKLEIYDEPWNEAYLKAVSNKIADNCYRNVAVNLLDKMVDKLLEMTIDMFHKDNANKEKQKVGDKLKKLIELRHIIAEYK